MTPKKIIFFAIGPIGGAILAFITLPIVAWLFEAGDVGKMALLQIVIGFSTLLFSLGLDQSYVREFHETDDHAALLKRSLLPGLLFMAVTIFILIPLENIISTWLFDYSNWQISLIVVVFLIADYISRFLSLILRMNERGIAFSICQLLPKLLLLIIIIGYYIFEVDKNFSNLMMANAVSVLFVCALLLFSTYKDWILALKSKIDIINLKNMLNYGLPLAAGGVAYWGLSAVDKIFLRWISGFEELAVYSLSVSFAGVAVLLQTIFSTVWAPTVYKWASRDEGLENIDIVTRYILFLIVIIFSFAGLFSWVATLILPTHYKSVQWLLVSCLAAPLMYTLSEITAIGIGIARRTIFTMVATFFAFAINIIGNWLMIPIYGAAGAAVSTCISFWIFFVLRTEFSMHVWRSFPRLLLYTYSLLAVAGSSVFTLYGEELYIYTQLYWIVLLSIAIYSFRDDVKIVVNAIIKRYLTSKVVNR